MNKLTLIASAALLATFAQAAPTSDANATATDNHAAKTPRIGVIASIGTAGTVNTKHMKEDGYFGSEVGVGATTVYPLNHRFSANPSLMFAYRHETLDIGGAGGDIDTRVNELAIEAPLLMRFNVSRSFFIEAGPELGVLLSAKSEVESKVLGVSSTDKEDITDERTRFEIGVGAGVGYEFTDHFAMDVRYNNGLRQIDDKGKTNNRPYQVALDGAYLF